MPISFYDLVQPDAVYCLGRALILGILVSSEALLAQRKRVGFEQHLILASASSLLLAAQLFVVLPGLFAHAELGLLPPGAWVWYPILTTVGLTGIAFCFDFTGSKSDEEMRLHSKRYLLIAGILFSVGAVLTGLQFKQPYSSVPPVPPATFEQLGGIAFLLHGGQALAMLLLMWKAAHNTGTWLSATESRVFLLGCFAGLVGVVLQIRCGPREYFSTLAFTVLVAVVLRDNYRRSEMEAVHAYEDRGEKMLLFHRITTQLKSSSDLPQLYEILMDSLVSNLGAESGGIYLRSGVGGDLRPEFIHGPLPPSLPLPEWCPEDLKVVRKIVRETKVPLGEGIVGKVAQSGTPAYLYDVDDVRRHYTWGTGIIQVRSAIVLPLRSPEGIYGVVLVVNRVDGESFSEEDLRFMSLLVEQAGLAIYNARLHAERLERQRAQEQIKIARHIQLRLLPSKLPEIPGLTVGAEYSAAQEVGGDYYDLYRIDHDHLGLIVFDVAGKGVPAALLMAITATFLKMAAPRSCSPAWVLNEVNAALSGEMHRGLYVTALYAVLTISTGEIALCSAGHPDAIIVNHETLECRRLKPRGAALGLLRPNRFRMTLEQTVVVAQPGDTIILYTDGVLEARDAEGREFGEERLCAVARQCARKNARDIAKEIIVAMREHAGEEPQYDDTTVLVLQLAPNGTPRPWSAS